MITPNFFHMCFFTCFFFLGGLWTIFMIILTHNLFAEAHNSWLTFGHSFWHFVVDDFVVRRRRRSHADQWIKTNKFSSNFQVEIQTEINLFSNLFPSKFQYKKSSPTSQKHFCSEETHMEKCQRYHTNHRTDSRAKHLFQMCMFFVRYILNILCQKDLIT